MDLKTGEYLPDDPSFDQRKASKDPEQSIEDTNAAQVKRIPPKKKGRRGNRRSLLEQLGQSLRSLTAQ